MQNFERSTKTNMVKRMFEKPAFHWEAGRGSDGGHSWIVDQQDAHEKLICQRTRRATTIPRPPLESSRRGESRSAWYTFVNHIFDLLIFETSETMAPTKNYQADLDPPRRIR